MRTLGLMILSFTIAIALASILKNTKWMRERDRKLYGWLCEKTGGKNLRMHGWTVECEYSVDKKGNLIKP